MARTNTSIITPPINYSFIRRYLTRAKYYLHYFNGTMPATIQKYQGTSTALWRRYEHQAPTTTPLTELDTTQAYPTRPASQPTVTPVEKPVLKYGDYFELTEEVDFFNFNGQSAELTDVLAAQAGRSINMVQRNEMEDNATLIRVTDSGTSGANDAAVNSAITAQALDRVVNELSRNVAEVFLPMTPGSRNIATTPIMASYIAVAHPDVMIDISKLTGYVSVEKYGQQTEPFIGECGYYGRAGKGIRFVQSEDASIDAAAGATPVPAGLRGTGNVDLYTVPIYGKYAVGSLGLENMLPENIVRDNADKASVRMYFKGYGSAGTADPLDELQTLGWKAWSAAKILNAAWIRGIRCGASSLA